MEQVADNIVNDAHTQIEYLVRKKRMDLPVEKAGKRMNMDKEFSSLDRNSLKCNCNKVN